MNELIDSYFACWNETDPGARRVLIERTWTADARYVDPMVEATGVAAIGATIAAVQEQFPGFVFRLDGDVDAHHGQARFRWALGPDGAEPVVVGFDVAVVAEDGRLASVYGWLDRVPV